MDGLNKDELSSISSVVAVCLKPFNALAGHDRGRHFFSNKPPAAIARELFKPSTDSASLLVSIKKTLFDSRFSLGDVTKRACL